MSEVQSQHLKIDKQIVILLKKDNEVVSPSAQNKMQSADVLQIYQYWELW